MTAVVWRILDDHDTLQLVIGIDKSLIRLFCGIGIYVMRHKVKDLEAMGFHARSRALRKEFESGLPV